MLSDSESETENVHTFTINEHYAKAFEYKKEREELEKRASSDLSFASVITYICYSQGQIWLGL